MIIIVLLCIVLIYLFAIHPRVGTQADMSAFERVYIAHRGYFDNAGPCPENSLAAFRRAVEKGYGIELDVQLTSDNKLVVFHDASLLRMCNVDKILHECTFKELQQYRLANSNEKIPLFTDVLSLVAGAVPLVVEVKPAGDVLKTTETMYSQMKDYKGVYCMESFHPLAVAWFKKYAPQVVRGQLSMNFFKDEKERGFWEKFVLSNLLLNWLAGPQFIAYNHQHADQFSYRLCRKISKVKNVAWTIRSQEELEKAKEVFSVIIFDSFQPK